MYNTFLQTRYSTLKHNSIGNAILHSIVFAPSKSIYRLGNQKESVMQEYLSVLVYIGIAFIVSGAILGLSFIFGRVQHTDVEKLSAYECGFDPFDDARSRFDIRFYLVAILFLIFDLEVSFLFPWTVCLSSVGFFGFLSMMIFLGVLTLGFVYEWCKGALDWE